MQRYFVDKKEFNKFTLNIKDSHHIENVMRMNIGDNIEVVFEKDIYLTKIVNLNPVVTEIIEKLDNYEELPVKVTICQSLVNESKMDLILQKGTELGAYCFIPFKATNSIIKCSKKDFDKKYVRWQRIVYDASRQSKRNYVPEVKEVIDINELARLKYDLKILCTVNEVSRSLKNVLQNHKKCGTMIIVIGPEGGFTKSEEEILKNNGFISTSLGNLVLRTETTTLAVLSQINYEFER